MMNCDKSLPNVNDLKVFGFKECGEWTGQADEPQPNISDKSIKNALYAFSTEDVVGYIGITEGSLYNRLRAGYAAAVYQGIRQSLANNKKVYILSYDPEGMKYRDLDVDLVRGLEIPLQRRFKSQWTTKGYGGYKRLLEPLVEEILEQIKKKMLDEKNRSEEEEESVP